MTEQINSQGPWTLEPDRDLEPGETAVFDLRRMTFRGRKGYFKPKLPLDEAQIINQDGANPLNVEFNGVYDTYVVPNAVEGFSQAGITRIVVENAGASTVSASDITVEVALAAYDADERAREQAQETITERAVSALTGGVL